jgi:hypothetical protein
MTNNVNNSGDDDDGSDWWWWRVAGAASSYVESGAESLPEVQQVDVARPTPRTVSKLLVLFITPGTYYYY